MADQPSPPDLAKVWSEWLTQTERQWNEAFNNAMNNEEFSAGLGRWLDLFLHLQRVTSEAMGTQLMALNLPTRTDILELGDRLLQIENRLAALEAAVAAGKRQAAAESGAPARRPARTKRPQHD